MNQSEQNIAEHLKSRIEHQLSKLGLLVRVFARAKTIDSIQNKMVRKGYDTSSEKRMQDLYGVRVALYFPDDSELAQKALKSAFDWDSASSTIDLPTDATFGPTRCNLIFRLPNDLREQSAILKSNSMIDSTFEVQFRTVFSEGWHEVEHDLRYKCKDDWKDHADLNRAMNGLVATLETCDWAIMRVFDDLAWRHYKDCKWLPMLKSKFRLRWQVDQLDGEIVNALDNEHELAKAVFRVSRTRIMSKLFELNIDLPITPSNMVYIANHFYIKSATLSGLTPMPVKNELKGS